LTAGIVAAVAVGMLWPGAILGWGSFDPRDKRVAVVGTGCSAAQIVPAIVESTAALYLFQRSPAFVVPASAKAFDWRERLRFRAFPSIRRRERQTLWEAIEAGFVYRTDPAIRKERVADYLRFLESQVSDEGKRRQLIPEYEYGCKRPVMSDSYLKSLDNPKVEIVTSPIERIDRDGLRTVDGKHYAVDAILYGTGFSAAKYLSTMSVTGAGGQPLADAWHDGPEAYLGMMVAGFPNFFLIYGPNTNTANSIVYIIECQAKYITECIRGIAKRGLRSMSPLAEAQADFNRNLQRTLSRTVWSSDCHSYQKTETGKNVTQWPEPSAAYRDAVAQVNWQDYVTID